jgi:medium-chain acyl-[acyl-carrier-protein] hydrolase
MSLPEEFQYTREFEVGSYQVQPNGNLRLTSLGDLLQEIAWKHADSGDFGRNLLDSQQMWVLSRLEIRVDQFPKWGDRIRIFTGGRGADKLFAFREFLVWDQQEQVLARAMSSWLLLHTETKRIQRPEVVLPTALFDPGKKPQWQPEKLTIVGELLGTDSVRVRASDVDLNHHVNNTSYIRWIEDFSADLGIFPNRISINYLAECKAGDMVDLSCLRKESDLYLEGKVGGKQVFTAKLESSSQG